MKPHSAASTKVSGPFTFGNCSSLTWSCTSHSLFLVNPFGLMRWMENPIQCCMHIMQACIMCSNISSLSREVANNSLCPGGLICYACLFTPDLPKRNLLLHGAVNRLKHCFLLEWSKNIHPLQITAFPGAISENATPCSLKCDALRIASPHGNPTF